MNGVSFRPIARPGEPGAFDVHVPRDLPWFEGHFEGEPILAAVVQLELLVLCQVRATWPELSRVRRLSRLRFKRPIRPDDDLELRLERPGPLAISFEIRRGGEVWSAGSAVFVP